MGSTKNSGNEILVANNLPPHIPPGKYEVMLDYFETALMFSGKAPKLILTCTITSYGEAFGKRICRYYNVIKLIGPAGRNGKFKANPKGDFLREFLSLFPVRASRLDRLPMSHFNGVVMQAKVVTVKRARGRDIPKPLQYSKIENLEKVIPK